MTITQYLGAGTISRGRLDIQANMNTRVVTPPYLRNQYDKEAVIQGLDYMRGVLSQVQNLTWITPTATQNTTAFVNSVSYPSLATIFDHCASRDDTREKELICLRSPLLLACEVQIIGPAPVRLALQTDAQVEMRLLTLTLRFMERTICLLWMRPSSQE